MDEIQYPSNSIKSRQVEQEKKNEVAKVTQGKVVQKKKSAGKQIVENFIKEDAKTIKSHILFDIIIPTVKDMISSGFHAALDMLLYGDDRQDYRRSGTRIVTSGSRVNYNAISQKKKYAPMDRVNPCEEIAFEDRADAQRVLDELTDQIDQFGMVSAYDLYEAAGLSCEWTLKNWGWYDLINARVVRTRDGDFVIELPRMISLKNR